MVVERRHSPTLQMEHRLERLALIRLRYLLTLEGHPESVTVPARSKIVGRASCVAFLGFCQGKGSRRMNTKEAMIN